MWSLFGLNQEKTLGDDHFATHDMIGGLLVQYGAVGLLVAITLGSVGLYIAHTRVLRIRDRDSRRQCICYLSILFGLLFTGALSGSHLHVFPINYMFWMITGFLVTIVVNDAAERRKAAPAVAPGVQRRPVPGRVPAGAASPAFAMSAQPAPAGGGATGPTGGTPGPAPIPFRPGGPRDQGRPAVQPAGPAFPFRPSGATAANPGR